MKIYIPPFLSNLKNRFIILDTNTLIALLSFGKEFAPFITELIDNGCTFLTIPSVRFEFSRTETIEGYNKRTELLKNLCTIYPIERHLEDFNELILVLQKINGKMSYTDFLLYCCLYKFRDAYLLTENHKDFLTSILYRETIITLDGEDKEIRNIGVYTFDSDKYEKAASSILHAS